MGLVVRHRCQRCGALWDGHSGASPWIRCASCKALVDFDWQTYFESDAYRSYLASAAEMATTGWPRYQAAMAEGNSVATIDPKAALVAFRRASELQLALTPHCQPPEAQVPGAYRDAVLNQLSWWSLQIAIDPEVARCQRELEANQRSIDWRNPVPTLNRTVEILRQQARRLDDSDAPPDPDAMTGSERCRIWAGMFVGAFLPMLSAEQRLGVVKQLHGEANVSVRGASDESGIYFDWTCSLCGLTSLQGRTVTELCCLGCYFRRPLRSSDLSLDAVSTPCAGCGAASEIPSGALQATCSYCHVVSTRHGRTGAVERAFSASLQAQFGATPLPEGGVAGVAVTAENRTELVLSGLARIASYYGPIINAERFSHSVRPSLQTLGLSPASAMNEIRIRIQREGGSQASLELLDACEVLLAPR